MEFIDIPKPHGKLIYDGEQTLIPFDKELKFTNPIMLVSNGLAYGELTLAENPIQTNEKTFQRKEYFLEHRVFADERKRLWPDTKIFYLYKIQSFDPIEIPRKVDISNGDLVFLDEIDLSDTDKKFIDKAKKLPKTIILKENEVVVDSEMRGFGSGTKNEELSIALASVNFGNGDNEKIRQEDKLSIGFPVYDLALVKKDNFVKSVDDAPNYRPSENPDMLCGNCGFNRMGFCSLYNFFWDRGYTCDSWQDDIVDVMSEAIEDKLQRIEGQFRDTFSQYMSDKEHWEVWISKTFKNYVIVSWEGNFYRVRYTDEGEEVKFQGPEAWVLVQFVPMEKDITEDKKEGRRLQSRMLKRLQEAWQTLSDMITWASPKADDDEEYQKQLLSMIGVKEIDGVPWYVSFSTNSYIDREKEIFSLKSLENYVGENETREDKGYFNLWHIPGTDFARKEWQAVIGKFLVEAGPFLDNSIGQAALKFFTEYPQSHPEMAPEGWGHSPEFRFLPEDRLDGIYEWIWITRTSVLPKAAAANIFTMKGNTIMAMSEDQRKFAEEVMGKENLNVIEKLAEKETAKLDEEGVASKQKETPETTKEEKSTEEEVPEKEKSSEEETSEKETEKTSEGKEKIDLTFDEIVEAAAKAINVNIQPLAEGLTNLIEIAKNHDERFVKLEERLRIKELTEDPKYTVSVTKPAPRASESDKTKLEETDELLKQKPKEAQHTDGSAASSYFGNKK